jgi:hypothetical protein
VKAEILTFPKKKKVVKNDLDKPRWFCLVCDSDEFKIMADGDAYCRQCTCRINNLRCVDTGKQ